MALSQGPKKNYRCDRSLQQFYTGGPFTVGRAPRGEGESEGDAEAFLACACGSELRVVSAADASTIGEPIDGDSEAVTGIALSPDFRLLFAAGHSKLIRVWDLASRTCIRSWKVHVFNKASFLHANKPTLNIGVTVDIRNNPAAITFKGYGHTHMTFTEASSVEAHRSFSFLAIMTSNKDAPSGSEF